jgi:predicted transposase/invertase (TIGR01784 family)
VDAFREGKAEGKTETAWKMKAKGMPSELITELTGLSAEEIKRLR